MLTSTAIVMQMLQERGTLSTLKGQRIIAILLFEDLAIVPLLAIVTLLGTGAAATDASERWTWRSASPSAPSSRWFWRGATCSTRCSGCWPLPARAR